jgi:hypothetical protein
MILFMSMDTIYVKIVLLSEGIIANIIKRKRVDYNKV